MYQFTVASIADFENFRASLGTTCNKFSDQILPRGCHPSKGAIGFEQSGESGIVLFVQRGVTYQGTSEQIQQWLVSGEKRFETIETLTKWLKEEIYPQLPIQHETQSRGGTFNLSALDKEENNTIITDRDEVTSLLTDQEKQSLVDPEKLKTELEKSIIGQSPSLETISEDVSRFLLKKEHQEPLTFFAVGPPGVGKTLTANKLAKSIKEASNGAYSYKTLLLHMNEYSEEHRVSQLFGSPQGYVGYNEGAQLADALTEEPHTIVIFDEIEKAHPKIHQVLMNLFNTGTFSTPTKGSTGSREIHCSQAIFYCTSNILRGEIPPELDREDSWAIDMYIRKQVVAAGWKSEIVDRINRFLWFSVLKQDDLVSVTLQELQKICESYSVQLSSVEPKVIAKMLMGVKDTSSVRRIAKHIEQQLDVRLLAVADTSIPYRLIGPNPYQLVPNIQKGGVLCLED